MYKQRKFLRIIVVLIVITGLILPVGLAFAQIDPSFNPSVLIQDKVFTDTRTFGGPEGIQKFLEKKGSILANTSQDFLMKLREPGFADLKTKLEDPRPSLGRLRSAAELVWDASQQSGLNPQVFIVKLQKEQGLITNDPKDKLQRALDYSLGFGCPDNSPCNGVFQGFYFQLFGGLDQQNERYLGAGKSLMKAFNIPIGQPVISLGGRIGRVGEVMEITNTTDPHGVPPSQQVLLSNRATAALYRYTPHVFNGNYNFWKYFNEWFKYPNGTIMQVSGDSPKYIIQNGNRYLLPNFVAQAKGIDVTQTIAVSPTEVENYPVEKNPLGPEDNTIVNVVGDVQKYVFLNNAKRPASDFVIKQRKLDPLKSLSISLEESKLFENGEQLTPSDGTILRGQTNQAVYLVESASLKAYSAFTFKQHKIAVSRVQIIPDSEVDSYPKKGYVPPLDGTIVKAKEGDLTVYEIGNGKKLPLSGELFKNRGIAAKSIVLMSPEELAGLEQGGFSTPRDKTFYKLAETGEQYYFNAGQTKRLLPLVIKQQKITPDFSFSLSEHASWTTGAAVSPREGTVIKGDSTDAVYLVSGKKLRPLTFEAFKRRKITANKIIVIPQTEVATYEKGEVLVK